MKRTVCSAVLCLVIAGTSALSPASVDAQQLPPGVTMEQWNSLSPQQQAEILRRLQQSGATAATAQTQEVQLPPILEPQVTADTPTVQPPPPPVDQPYEETPYDFGTGPGGPESLQELELFGRDIFRLEAETWEPVMFGPVGPDYEIGPGDQLIIHMWGEYQEIYNLTVNREGYILIPDVGQVVVTNLTVEQTRNRLLAQMTESYQALNFGRPGATAFLDVTLGKLRIIKVYVLGGAVRQGAYNLSSISTAFTALYIAGGPSNLGSIRAIRVIRGDTMLKEIDLYDYLLSGDKSADTRLRDGDIVFIPDIGPKVAIRGRVQRPAVYELKGEEHLKDIMRYAGGPTAAAYLERSQIIRIVPPDLRDQYQDDRVTIDVNLRETMADAAGPVSLFDGDVVSIFSVLNLRRDFVVVEGAVWRPAQYQYIDGMRLTDAIEQAEGLKEEAYLDRVDIIRTNPDYTTTQLRVVLADALRGDPAADLELEMLDRITIHSIHDIEPNKYVNIAGHVRRPGRYLLHEEMRLSDLLFKAGGLYDPDWRKETYLQRADLIRVAPDSISRTLHTFNLGRILDGDFSEDIVLQSEDLIRIFSIDRIVERDKFVRIEGHVWTPSEYLLFENMRISDLLILAGGLQDPDWRKETYLQRADLIRVAPDSITRTIESFDLGRILDGDSPEDRLLRAEDLIRVYSIYAIEKEKSATILGEVKNPDTYEIEENTTVNDLILRAGGLTHEAWTVSAEVSRISLPESGTERRVSLFSTPIDTTFTGRGEGFQLQDFDLVFIRRIPLWELQRNVRITGEVRFPGPYTLETPDETISSVLERAGGITPYAYPAGATLDRPYGNAGLVGIDLEKAMRTPGSRDDLVMMPGDELNVPEYIPTVRVTGAVAYPTSILFKSGGSLSYYISRAGGYLKDADPKRTHVVLANGAVWKPRWFILPDPPIGPGAMINVLMKAESQRDVWEVIRDTTAILTSFTTVLLLIWRIGG